VPLTPLRAAVAEGVATGFLLMAIVGSGIMAERLAGGNVALALLSNAIVTGSSLTALILVFGPISGAHLNPLVTASEAVLGQLRAAEVAPRLIAQLAGAILGVVVAHVMFELPVVQVSQHVRAGVGPLTGEIVATFGLFLIVTTAPERPPAATAAAVGLYITGAYWFTSSTSFANPAVTLARTLTDTFAGIRPVDAPGFIAAQGLGALAATALIRWLGAPPAVTASEGRS
jgi:glycerol uptake facilitator-like aquaporin